MVSDNKCRRNQSAMYVTTINEPENPVCQFLCGVRKDVGHFNINPEVRSTLHDDTIIGPNQLTMLINLSRR